MRSVICIAALFLAAAAVKLPRDEKPALVATTVKEVVAKGEPSVVENKVPEKDVTAVKENADAKDTVKAEKEKLTVVDEPKKEEPRKPEKEKVTEDETKKEEPRKPEKEKVTEDEPKKEEPRKPEKGKVTEDETKKEEPRKPEKEKVTEDETKKTTVREKEDKTKAETEEDTRVKYHGVQVLRVVVTNKEQKKFLRELETNGEIQTWLGNGTAIDIMVKKDSAITNLKQKQLSYDVVIQDLQKAIDEENPVLSEDELELQGKKVDPFSPLVMDRAIGSMWGFSHRNSLLTNNMDWFAVRKPPKKKKKRGYRLTWQMYHRMADIHSYLDYLVANYPQMCSMESIGQSVEGRPLNVLKISSGHANSHGIWVDAGIHAREWITPATATYIISQIVEGGDGPQGIDWYFQPLVNPDGYEHSHKSDRLWRKNRANPQKGSCAGTDLNRNFGYRWGGQGASKQPCRETYAGAGPFSEPETAAIDRFITGKKGQVKAYVSLHSYGQYILYPWGYDRKVPPDYADLDRVGREMAQSMRKVGGQSYTVGSAASTLYPASGGSDDWAKGTAKVKYSYTIELRDTGRHGFVLPAQYIVPTAKEAYAALRTLAREVQLLKKK